MRTRPLCLFDFRVGGTRWRELREFTTTDLILRESTHGYGLSSSIADAACLGVGRDETASHTA
jgi:hypothetical protein